MDHKLTVQSGRPFNEEAKGEAESEVRLHGHFFHSQPNFLLLAILVVAELHAPPHT